MGYDNCIYDKIHNHPCYSEEAHYHYARIHLPVAPACNIQCNFCNRLYDCPNESRPGVTSELLTPEEALKKVLMVAGRMPNLTVVGIAGPGDPLANRRRTFKTLELIRQNCPDMRLCISTNGLMLPDSIAQLQALDVQHVTITINAIDPEVGRDIYERVVYRGRRYNGVEASRLLIERQLEGLSRSVDAGMLIKVNSVLIPGINAGHLAQVSQRVRRLGAFLHNIMPLILCQGSRYAEWGIREPTFSELKALQDSCEAEGMGMMRHCRQCRADAVGLLGEDRYQEFTRDKIEKMEIDLNQEERAEVQDGVARVMERARREREELGRDAGRPSRQRMLMAVASKGGRMVNQHFGHAKEFMVYEVLPEEIRFVGIRRVAQFCGGPETCGDNPNLLPEVMEMLKDCRYILCSRMGALPRAKFEAAGIGVVEAYDLIETVIDRVAGYGIR